MEFHVENLPEAIREAKEKLRRELPGYATVFQKIENQMRRSVAEIVKEREAGETVIPVLHYSDIAAATVSPAMISKIRDRGACIIRETFAPEQARAWDDEIGRYVEENGLTEKLANAAEDKYFGNLAASETADLRHLLVASPGSGKAIGVSHPCPRVSQPAMGGGERGACSYRPGSGAGVRRPDPQAPARGQFARALASCGRWIG